MTFRRSVTRFLADYRWYALGVGGVAALALGCIGFAESPSRPQASYIVYQSLRLFLLEGEPEPHAPLPLNIARFLAPIVAGYAGLAGLAALFRDRVQQMRIPLLRGHIVICGLGYVGSVFLRHLR